MKLNNYRVEEKHFFDAALWLSQTSESEAYLSRRIKDASHIQLKELEELIALEPPDLTLLIPENSYSNDMLLGAFFATGSQIYIRNLIKTASRFSERDDFFLFTTAATARWALASLAQDHVIIRNTLSEELPKYKGEEKQAIREVIQASRLPAGYETLYQQMKQVLEQQKALGKWTEYMK